MNLGFTIMWLITVGSATFQVIKKTCLLRCFACILTGQKRPGGSESQRQAELERPGLPVARSLLQAHFLYILKSF